MKLQLDLGNKVIRLSEKVNIGDLYNTLKKLFPQGEWKEFSIEIDTTIIWKEVINIPLIPYYPIFPVSPTNPYSYPWWGNPIVICDTNTSNNCNNFTVTYSLTAGTYNVQV